VKVPQDLILRQLILLTNEILRYQGKIVNLYQPSKTFPNKFFPEVARFQEYPHIHNLLGKFTLLI